MGGGSRSVGWHRQPIRGLYIYSLSPYHQRAFPAGNIAKMSLNFVKKTKKMTLEMWPAVLLLTGTIWWGGSTQDALARKNPADYENEVFEDTD